ncbi:hypothetical protein TcasGA2_TC034849 [Tribolium castaneum]|uniref:Uncharacterized protein n=1 Tax=Tribolium castaneum TaxID=7070 RepID=A0A139WCX4_TRICA|nr:hypothetical protein TcasGA2_TC034849 [Tribolium castaneum]
MVDKAKIVCFVAFLLVMVHLGEGQFWFPPPEVRNPSRVAGAKSPDEIMEKVSSKLEKAQSKVTQAAEKVSEKVSPYLN